MSKLLGMMLKKYTRLNKLTARNIRNAIKGDSFALGKIDEVENNIAQLRAKIRPATEVEE